MSIGDLLRQAQHGSSDRPAADSLRDQAHDALFPLRDKAQKSLFGRLGNRLYDPDLSEGQLRNHVTQELDEILSTEVHQLSPEERSRLVDAIAADILGLGPIEAFLDDPTVTEIMVNADDAIFVERAGRLYLTDSRFVSVPHLRQVIEKIVAAVGRRIDESSPMVDARLPDGSRINAIVPPLAVDGPMLTIRKFVKAAYTASDLIDLGTLTPQTLDFLDACVRGRRNILITGGTGTGKTTMLNAVSAFIPDGERIVTIEDAVELQLDQRHVVRLEARPPNIEGRGAISIRDLVRNALRMRPDRIIVGEVRGGEALDMLQAMNTGHEGSLSTVHANTTRDALSRLETMVLMAGLDLPARSIREQIVAAVDVIVHVSRLRDGTRRVTEIAEVTGLDGESIQLSSLYAFDFSAGVDETGRFIGRIRPTGVRPKLAEELYHLGIELTHDLLRSPIEGLGPPSGAGGQA